MFIKQTGKIPDKINPYCGEISELLLTDKSPNLSIAMAFNIKPTIGHYHKTFDEVYLLIDGHIKLEFYHPQTKKIWQESLKQNELCMIGKEIHHRIIEASESNRLCVICTPKWVAEDEFESDILNK